jgi:tetratricopeptide (TPR) repeat protein
VTEAPVDNTSFVVQCFLLRSGRHFDEGAYEVAGDDLRRALALDPKNEAARANLAASEFNLAVNASNQGRCDEARAILGRGTPRSRWRDVLEPCWVNQTAKLGGAGAFDVALVAARHGLQDVPDSEALQKNLLTVQQSLAIAAARAQRCDEVKRWARELEARAPEFVAKLKRACQ